MPRYVILRHETAPTSTQLSHWDVMLEEGTVLRTWACDSLPGSDGVVARQLPDHRRAYLEYEGPISEGRGTVKRWDEGDYEVTSKSPKQWTVRLDGKQLVGCLELTWANEGNLVWTARFTPTANP